MNYSDPDVILQFRNGKNSGKSSAIFGIAALSAILLLEIYNLYEKRREVRANNITRNSVLLLMLLTVTALIHESLGLYLFTADWTNKEELCNRFTQAGMLLSYVLVKQAIYIFLFERVRIVYAALHLESNTFLRICRNVAFFLIATGGNDDLILLGHVL
jgi:hypothetical protein